MSGAYDVDVTLRGSAGRAVLAHGSLDTDGPLLERLLQERALNHAVRLPGTRHTDGMLLTPSRGGRWS